MFLFSLKSKKNPKKDESGDRRPPKFLVPEIPCRFLAFRFIHYFAFFDEQSMTVYASSSQRGYKSGYREKRVNFQSRGIAEIRAGVRFSVEHAAIGLVEKKD